MKKVSELSHAELDYWVGKAQGIDVVLESWMTNPPKHAACWLRLDDGRPAFGAGPYAPSSDWAQGGPIIERESIAVFRQEYSDGSLREWMAGSSHDLDEGPKMKGSTPLIAAMRAYVAMKFGEEVDL